MPNKPSEAIAQHHAEQFQIYCKNAGLDIERYTEMMPRAKRMLKELDGLRLIAHLILLYDERKYG